MPRNSVPCANMGYGYVVYELKCIKRTRQLRLHHGSSADFSLAFTDLWLRSELPFSLSAALPLRLHRTNATQHEKKGKSNHQGPFGITPDHPSNNNAQSP